jgi:hypothetical protein
VKPKGAAKPKTAVKPKAAAPPPPPPTPAPSADPVGGALRTAAKVAETGVRVTAGVAQEIVRRLPRR